MAYSKPGETRKRVLAFVQRRLQEGRSPSVREVQAALGFRALESARRQLVALVEEGALVKREGEARGYRLPGKGGGVRRVPLLGAVQAGALTLALEEPEGFLEVGGHFGGGMLFALRVRGASMRDAGILDGDIVLVRKQGTARPGETVVALVQDEATVKVFRRDHRRRRVLLEPANPDFETLSVDAQEVRILGKVVEVRRFLNGHVPLV